MKKFIISEEEKKHIRGLYEVTIDKTQQDFYKACLGYTEQVLSKDPNKKTDINYRARLNNVKIFFQNKRDSINPPTLNGEENTIVKTVMTEVNNLIQNGKNDEVSNLINVGGGNFKSENIGI
jgi:hypothetical protein